MANVWTKITNYRPSRIKAIHQTLGVQNTINRTKPCVMHTVGITFEEEDMKLIIQK